ncbi:TPA: hypothetical protein ACOYAH_005632, partial [Klebsiella michiganensis]
GVFLFFYRIKLVTEKVLPLKEKRTLLKPALLFIRLIPSWFTHKQPCIKSKKNLKQSPCRKQRRLASGFARAAVTIPFIG